jgi:hypothetical protein
MPIKYDEQGAVKRPNKEIQLTKQMIEEFVECAKSVIYFAEKFYYIVHPVKGKMKIQLFDYQKEMLTNFQTNRFNILNCGRQLGKTTCSAIYILWFAMFNKEKKVAILANKADIAKKILEEIKLAYTLLPEYIKQGIVEFNAYNIKFDNGSEIICRATSPNSLRGHAISLLFLDEVAFVSPPSLAEEFWTSNLPTLSCLPKDTIILTDKGMKEIGDFIPENSKKGDYIPINNLNVWGKDGIEPASHFYVSPKSQTKIIRTKFGMKHESTLDHPIMCLDENGIGMKKCKDIKIGDYLRVDYGMNVYGNIEEANFELDCKNTVSYKILEGTKKLQESYINWLFETQETKDLCGNILYNNNQKILMCVQLMLLNMGILSSIEKSSLTILNTSLDTYHIPALSWIQNELPIKCNNINLRYLQSIRYKHEFSEKIESLIENKCFYVKVTSIEDNINDTYDLTCPNTHTFLQNGILGSNTGGSAIVVSTPKGTANLFYKIWKDAIDGQNSFVPLKVTWRQHPDRDEEWYKDTIKNVGKMQFLQEHECEFFGSSKTLIDGTFIVEHLKSVEPINQPDLHTKYWNTPKRGRRYCVSLDISHGIGADFSVANVFDITDGPNHTEQVFCYRRNDINVPEFTDIVYKIAKEWNNAYIIAETNGNLGEELIRLLSAEPYEYENLFYDYEKNRFGVFASRNTKPVSCAWLKEFIEQKNLIIKDKSLMEEFGYFEEIKENVFKSAKSKSCHDDLVMTCVWLSYFLKSKYFEDIKDSWPLEDAENFDDDNSESNENHAYDVWNSFLQKDFTDVEENWLDRDINQNSNYEKLAPDPRSGPIWW